MSKLRFLPRSLFVVALIVLGFTASHAPAQTDKATGKWEKEIQAFEAADKTNPPPQNAILFVGSSTIRIWKTLAQDFPGKPVINRGFGGSQIEDSTALADRIIIPYHPRLIVFYAGDNDLAAGKSAEQVISDFRAFKTKVQGALPEARILYISIKPSVLRWKLNDKIMAVNKEITTMQGPKLGFVNLYPEILGEDGKPRPELFLKDGLHMSDKGYAILTRILKPQLD